MGQPGIHILNKTGYSMFWNSMWDNKIMYTRMLKENIFLEKFFNLSLNDSISTNTIKFSDKNVNIFKKNIHIVDSKKSSIYKHLINLNKIKHYSSKIWVLRYQKWIILYHFLYILNFDKNKSILLESNDKEYSSSSTKLLTFHKKINNKIKLLFILKKKNNLSNVF